MKYYLMLQLSARTNRVGSMRTLSTSVSACQRLACFACGCLAGLSLLSAADNATLTVSGGQIFAERILWTGNGPTGSGSLNFSGGLIQVESSLENVTAGPSASPLSGSTKLLDIGSELTLSGASILQSQRLGLIQGGTVFIQENAVLDITGSAIESEEGSGLTSDFHPTFDFIQPYLNGTWSQVQGQIVFRNAGTGIAGQGPLLRVLGQSETLSNGLDSVVVDFKELFLSAIDNEKIVTNIPDAAFRVEWDGTYTKLWLVLPRATVEAVQVFHAGWSGSIDESIDSGKLLAKQGLGLGMLSYGNLINSSRGINGIMFEIDSLGDPNSLSADDFVFQVSPTGAFSEALNPLVGWETAPPPNSVSILPGSPDRILLLWPENSIMNRWLRITILANANTDLPANEVYYLGHLLGETTGETSGAFFVVQFDDISRIRNEIGNTVDSSSTTDIDKNGVVTFSDIAAMRPNIGAALTRITIP
jgi:hypothetical protein